jgi:hypothetical protein
MKKIISLFIVFLAYFHPAMSNAKEVNNTIFSITHQEQSNSIFNQPATQNDFIGTDLLELTEDEISHFEKKFLANSKPGFKRDDYSFDFYKEVLVSRIKLTDTFINPLLSIQSFIGIYRI